MRDQQATPASSVCIPVEGQPRALTFMLRAVMLSGLLTMRLKFVALEMDVCS